MEDWEKELIPVGTAVPPEDDWEASLEPVTPPAAAPEVPPAKEFSNMGQGEAALIGLRSGATKGWDARFGAWLQEQLAKTAEALPRLPPGNWTGIENYPGGDVAKDIYDDALQSNFRQYDAAVEQHPKTVGATELVGDIGSDLIIAAGTGGVNLTPAGQALTGALEGAGRSRSDLLSGETALNVGVGAGLGGAFGALGRRVGPKKAMVAGAGLGEGLGALFGESDEEATKRRTQMALGGSVSSPVSSYLARRAGGARDVLKKFAGLRADKATGTTLRDIRKTGSLDDVAERGQFLLDRGAVKFGDTIEDVARRIAPLRQQAGANLGKSLEDLDAVAPNGSGVTPQSLAGKIDAEVRQPLVGRPGERDVHRAVESEIEVLNNDPRTSLSFKDAEGVKQSYDRVFDKMTPTDKDLAYRKIYGKIGDEVENAATATDPELAKKFLAAKKEYSYLRPAEDAAEDASLRSQANRWLSPTDYMTGGAAAAGTIATGQPDWLALLAVPLAHRLMRTRGSSMAAVTANKAAKVPGAAADVLGSPKVQAVGEAAWRAMSRSPNLRTTIEGLLEGASPEVAQSRLAWAVENIPELAEAVEQEMSDEP